MRYPEALVAQHGPSYANDYSVASQSAKWEALQQKRVQPAVELRLDSFDPPAEAVAAPRLANARMHLIVVSPRVGDEALERAGFTAFTRREVTSARVRPPTRDEEWGPLAVRPSTASVEPRDRPRQSGTARLNGPPQYR